MTAFDNHTNTGSATFTNAYGTVDLLASASVQKASGFVRTSGWRYWEMAIDDQGGDNSKLFVGAGAPTSLDPHYLVGGASKQAGVVGAAFAPPGPAYIASLAASMTCCTGDVFMFAADMTGAGRNHAGTVLAATTSDGAGNLLLGFVVEVGKNGAWPGVALVAWAMPSFGYPMRTVPWVVRDSTSASFARVSLRVATTSFAYPIPTGMEGYGDGPEGGTAAVDDFALAWDPAQKSDVSLSLSNYIAVNNATGAFPTTGYVMSTNMAGLTGKRLVEFTLSPFGNGDWYIGLFDSTSITNTFFGNPVNTLIWKNNVSAFRRGVDISNSVTNEVAAPFVNASIPGWAMMIDFDNKKVWTLQAGAVGVNTGPWMGDATVPAGGNAQPYPYSWGALADVAGLPISITASTSIVRIGTMIRNDSPVASMYINGGQRPYGMYPLLPGVTSMNGGRFVVAGQGDSWDVVHNPASMTYGASGLSIFPLSCKNAFQGAQTRFSGKKYFELNTEFDGAGNGVYYGIRRGDATTMSALALTALIDNALMVRGAANGAKFRYGTNIGSWTASNSFYTTVGYVAPWHGFAIDFDSGQMWVGSWNYATRTMNWGVGSDPATATAPHFTFTASTTMRIFCATLVGNMDTGATAGTFYRTTLIQDTNNLVGIPPGFEPWGGETEESLTATPSPDSGGTRNIWPTGMIG